MMDGESELFGGSWISQGSTKVGILVLYVSRPPAIRSFQRSRRSTLKFGDKKPIRWSRYCEEVFVKRCSMLKRTISLVKPHFIIRYHPKIKEKVHPSICAYHVANTMVMARMQWMVTAKILYEALPVSNGWCRLIFLRSAQNISMI